MTIAFKYYSPSTKGFYNSKIHNNIPPDAIFLSDEEYNDLLAAQSEGKVIEFKNGKLSTKKPVMSPEKQTKLNRLNEYGSIADQLDMIFWDKVNGTNLWVEHIDSVKKKYPKTGGE